MSEVKRYTASKNNISRHVKGRAIGTTDFVMVMASDYDAALAREAALREAVELKYRDLIEAQTAVTGWARKYEALQQRLTDAEKRAGDLKSLLREGLEEPKEGDDYIERVIEALKE